MNKQEPTRKLIVNVLGHGASKYTSLVFQALGLDILHEKLGKDGGVGCNLSSLQEGNYPDGTLILHQVREPRAQVTSLRAGVPLCDWEAYQTMAIRTGLSWRPLDEPVVKNSMRLWLRYNCSETEGLAEFSYRVEDMANILPIILDKLGLPAMPLPDISKKTNSHSNLPVLTWDELYAEDVDMTDRIIAKARQYGYADLPKRRWVSMKYIVNIQEGQPIGIDGQLLFNGDVVELTQEQSASRGVKSWIRNGTLTPENRTIRKNYGIGNMPDEIIVESSLGIGDLVFEEPGFRSLLKAGVKTIHLFARADGIKIYHDYSGVVVYPLDAKTAMLALAKSGMPVLRIDQTTHKKTGIENRVEAFTSYMLSSFNHPIPNPCPQPYIPVAQEHLEWAEMYVDKQEGQETILWHMESSRDYKNIPREQSIETIEMLLEKGSKVLVHANILQGIPRHKNLKELRGVSIERFMAICMCVDMVITMDSAPAWIAAAVNTEVLAVFGPTDPMRYAIRKSNVSVLQWNPGCGSQPCEEGCAHNRCIKQIPNAVLQNSIVPPERLAKWTDQIKQMNYENSVYPYIAMKAPIAVKPRPKLLALIPHLFLGGGETQMEYLLDRLPSYDITVIVINSLDDVMYPIWSAKYDLIHLGGADTVGILRGFISNISPDVILYHGHDILASALNGMKHKPVIIQIDHSACATYSEPILSSMSGYNDHVITVAGWLHEKYASQFPNRFTTVLNGVPTEPLKKLQKHRETRLGILTRLASGKGLDNLLDAMDMLPDRVTLTIGGWGEDESRLRSRSNDRVTFIGQTLDRKAFFDSIDCAVLPSEAEGNSMFLLEAAMASTPIITTNVGAVPELFEHNKSALITDGSPIGIKQAVMRLHGEWGLSERLAKSAYEIVSRKSSAATMAKGYDDVIISELERRQDPESILCFRNGGRGDVLMTIPAIKCLRLKFPGAKITYLLPTQLAAVIDGLGIVDEIIPMDEISDSQYMEISHNYDVSFYFRHDEVWNTGQHIIDYYLQLVGCETLGDRDISVNVDDVELPREYPAPYICLHHRSAYRCKNWGSDEQWKQLIEHLSLKHNIIQIGGDDQHDLGCIPAFKDDLTPIQTMRLLRDAECLIGVDSYPVHAAKAVGCAAIVLYGGSSNPDMCGYDDHLNLISALDCKCSGSKGQGIMCPFQYACMNYIKTEDIIDAIDAYMTA